MDIYEDPDILEYDTFNPGLKPYIKIIKAARKGPESLLEFKKD